MTLVINRTPRVRAIWKAIEQAFAESFVAEPQEIDQRVLDGAALLDEHHPRWADLIDLQKLELRNCSMCVLGQVYGDYDDGLHAIDRRLESQRFGFNTSDEGDWEVLQRSWEYEIRARQQ